MSIICCKDIQRAVEMLLIDAARLASGLLPAPPSPATIFLRKMSRRTCWSRGLATTNSVPNDVTYNMQASKSEKIICIIIKTHRCIDKVQSHRQRGLHCRPYKIAAFAPAVAAIPEASCITTIQHRQRHGRKLKDGVPLQQLEVRPTSMRKKG